MVVKGDGTKEVYNEDKIRTSATRVGVPVELQAEMLQHIRGRLFDGISTREIFAMVQEFLKHSPAPHLAMKYNLKAALAELGPSGYPFEKYLSLLLTDLGYHTQINQTLSGACVTHEVDILADKDNITYFIEAKFHKNASQRTDVRVALYIKARFDDLVKNWNRGTAKAWLITNTRFSTDAIKYAECQGILLTSWGYPKGAGITDLVENTGLHPVTMIDLLSTNDKMRLLASGVVTCRQLLDPQYHSLLPSEILRLILPQLERICQSRS